MKDKLNKDLALGDSVVFILPNYRELHIGTIIAFTPQNIRIEYVSDKYKSIMTLLQSGSQLIRIHK